MSKTNCYFFTTVSVLLQSWFRLLLTESPQIQTVYMERMSLKDICNRELRDKHFHQLQTIQKQIAFFSLSFIVQSSYTFDGQEFCHLAHYEEQKYTTHAALVRTNRIWHTLIL